MDDADAEVELYYCETGTDCWRFAVRTRKKSYTITGLHYSTSYDLRLIDWQRNTITITGSTAPSYFGQTYTPTPTPAPTSEPTATSMPPLCDDSLFPSYHFSTPEPTPTPAPTPAPVDPETVVIRYGDYEFTVDDLAPYVENYVNGQGWTKDELVDALFETCVVVTDGALTEDEQNAVVEEYLSYAQMLGYSYEQMLDSATFQQVDNVLAQYSLDLDSLVFNAESEKVNTLAEAQGLTFEAYIQQRKADGYINVDALN